MVDNKWNFRDGMSDHGVETQLHYTYNFSKTPVFGENAEQNMPGTEYFQKHAISIPSNPWLTDAETDQIIDAVKNCVTDKDLELCQKM